MSTIAVPQREAVLRRAVLLEEVAIAWMLVEGGVAIASGIAARSLALAAFGWDSLIEIITAGAVLWRMRAEAQSGDPSPHEERAQSAERLAGRVVAAGLLALALYIFVQATLDLRDLHPVRPPVWGLAVSVIAAVGMPVLYLAKRRVALLLDSEALRDDATGNLACGVMAVIVLAGLALQRWGWWWADPIAGLLVGLFVVREGWEAWGRSGKRPHEAALAYLGLGSNLGDRAAMLSRARALLEAEDLQVVAASRVYESPPWGVTDQPPFLNQVLEARTALPPRALLARCQEVEARLGRVRSSRWGPRTIDVDILLYGALRVAAPDLTIPHPQLRHRAFVLVPLADLAADLQVPGEGKVRLLLDDLPDRSDVQEYRGGSEVPGGASPPPARADR